MKTLIKLCRSAISLLLVVAIVLPYHPAVVKAEAAGLADFGNGSDGALVIGAGQTVTLHVPQPYVSVVEREYTSVYIESGGTLVCDAPNAGLVLRVQGDCTINGTIDQNGKAPKTNPGTTYQYPAGLQCGAGGNGGGDTHSSGGSGMSGRVYGGGYGGGGGGGYGGENDVVSVGNGGSAASITVNDLNIFIGGNGDSRSGLLGGGGGGGGGNQTYPGKGGNGAGANGGNGDRSDTGGGAGGGGGAGNLGGGVVIIYAAKNVKVSGQILCNGLSGGAGGSENRGHCGHGGGGGGGGGIYIQHIGTFSNTGIISAAGGSGGKGGHSFYADDGVAGQAGATGKIVVERGDASPPTISGVTVSNLWADSNTVTINATDASGVVSYAVSNSSIMPGNGSWQSSATFTLSSNGTYYAWAIDGLGNITAGFAFAVSRVDTENPVINSVSVTPSGWVGSANKTITVSAGDSQSGVAQYSISTNGTPNGWQSSNVFSKPSGSYYVWAKDNAGRVSAYATVTVDGIDTANPVINSVSVTPSGWVSSANKTITVSAGDSQSGVAQYSISTNGTPNGWQSSNVFSKPSGSYYVWARDNAGRVSAYAMVTVDGIDTAKPTISGVTVPTAWGQSGGAIINAADSGGSNIAGYAITAGAAPSSWQSSNSFTLTANGTYYGWVKDSAGNISEPKRFLLDKLDTENPVINSVSVTPSGWVGSANKTITVSAGDSQSGVAQYSISTNGTPNGWQSSNVFSKPSGSYYVWAKDNAGRVSESAVVTVDGIDTAKPTISGVTVPTAWGLESAVTIEATDSGGSAISGYAVTSDAAEPTGGWQSSNSFTLTENGSYYAWAKDNAGNTTNRYFTITKIDATPPVIGNVSVYGDWAAAGMAVVQASDWGSGIKDYAVSATAAMPTTGWQTSNSFTIAGNGTYYGWARDELGNLSAGKAFTVSMVDTIKPIVSSVKVPTEWDTTATVKLFAGDGDSGVTGYAVTTENIEPLQWQSSTEFIVDGNGTYYAWARDKAKNISLPVAFTVEKIDTQKPIVSNVTIPSSWSELAVATVTASDVGSGVKDYAVTNIDRAPYSGWQSSNSFTLTANGTYYGWARDSVGNLSVSFKFEISKIDTAKPTISGVTVPTAWGLESAVTIEATDSGGSAISGYAVTSHATEPTDGWQSSNSFTLTENGSYYAWAKDNAGNTASRYFTVTKIDVAVPEISSVSVPESWADSLTVTVYASDGGAGIKDYAISTTAAMPVDGWQTSNSFTLTANGTYYGWARDNAGNVSLSKQFVVAKVDRIAPEISKVELPELWSNTVKAKVVAWDMGAGIKDYAVTGNDAQPTTGWQTSNSFTLNANGTYYGWARDNAGNVSEAFRFTVGKVDTTKPAVKKVNIPLGWSNCSTVKIDASDIGAGIKDYAVTGSDAEPTTGWQSSHSFTLSKNGTFYAFVRDLAGNISAAFSFVIDKVDTIKPVVERVNIPIGWSSCSTVEIDASDVGAGIKDYATGTTAAMPVDGWQTSNSFTLTENGTYYGWARDSVGNVSAGKYFAMSRLDSTPPDIADVAYSADYSTVMVRGRDYGSGVSCIYIDGVPYSSATASADLAPGSRYIRLQVEDVAGNRSEEVTKRIPGWFDILDTITIEPVRFIDENQTAVITASGAAIDGIIVNEKLIHGNPVNYHITKGTEYLELQAQDIAGDRSAVYRVRVPGWTQEVTTLSIVSVQFSADNSSAQITAMESGGKGVLGIRVNGELQVGNPVTYEILKGTTHLKMQAEDTAGDRSAVLIRRVPGWSEIVTTLTVSDIAFTDYNTTAQITATATGGDSVDGIIVNDKFFTGNPVLYSIPKETTVLHVQAVNPEGDRSPMVNKAVPMDSSKSTLKLSIESPGWTKGRSVRVKLIAEDKNRITKILARTSEDKEWADITEQRYIDITADTTVYGTVENDKGETKEVSQYIECFDKTAPKVTAAQDGKTINIRATDDKSGVTLILINNKEYGRGDIEDGKLAYRIPEGTPMVTIKAEDAAGNLSRQLEIPITTAVTALPVIVAPTPSPSAPPTLPTVEAVLPKPEKKPLPPPERTEIPEEPAMAVPEQEQETIPPGARAAAAVGGIGASSLGGIWYWLRKKALSKPVEELELLGKKLMYDESEFGGSQDPLDKSKEKGE